MGTTCLVEIADIYDFDFTGAFFEKPVSEYSTPLFKGSMYIAESKSRQAVLDALKDDVFVRNGAWDFENVRLTTVFRSLVGSKLV